MPEEFDNSGVTVVDSSGPDEEQDFDDPVGSDDGGSSSDSDDTKKVQLTDVIGEDGFRKTEDQLKEDIASGNTGNLSQAPNTDEANTVTEDLVTRTQQEKNADVNLSGLQDSQGKQLTEQEALRELQENPRNVELGGGLRSSRSAILDSRKNRRENILKERRTNNSRSSQKSNDLILNVDGRTGKATEQGEKFFNEQERLRQLPTFSLTERSVAGELGSSIANQFAEGSRTIADLGQDLTGTEGDISTQAFGIPGTNKEVDIDNLFEGRGQPRQAFQETLAPLSVLQSRSDRFIDNQTEDTVEALREPGLQDSGEIPTVGETFVSGVTAAVGSQVGNQTNSQTFDERFTEARIAQERITGEVNKKFAAEVPEKTTESASLIGAGAAGLRNPERLGGELVAGSGTIAKKSVDKPLDFAAGEFVPDVTLDLLTGGGAAIATPQVRVAGSNVRSRADAFTQQVQSLREGGKQSPDSLTAAAETVVRNRPEQDVLSTDTANPANTPSPASDPRPGVDNIDITPRTPQTLDIINSGSRGTSLNIDTSVGTAIGASGARTASRPETDAISRPQSDAISRPQDDVIEIAEPFSEPIAEPQLQTFASPVARTQAVAEPVTEPIAEPIPEAVIQPRTTTLTEPDVDEDSEDSFNLFGTEQSRNIRRSVGADLLGLEDSNISDQAASNPLSLRSVSSNNRNDFDINF